MDMKTYLRQASEEEREALATLVKSSVGYFYLIGGGHRKPSPKLCHALVDAEPKFTLHELRPDIWSAAMDASAAEPEPDRHARRPIDPAKIMTAAVDQPALHSRKPSTA